MQLKKKILLLTILFFALLSATGVINLWFMQRNFAVCLEQNANVLMRVEDIRSKGLEMIGSVESLGAIQARTGVFPMRDVPGADKELALFNESYESLQKDIEALAEEKGKLFCSAGAALYCDMFLEQLEEQVEEVRSWGSSVIGSGTEKTLQGAQKAFDTVVDDFIVLVDDAVVRQHDYFQDEMEQEIKRSRQLLLTYCIEGLVIVILAIIVLNHFSGNISKRLRVMKMMVEKAGAGKYSIRFQDEARDEIGELARTMNETVVYLEETRQALEKNTRELAVQLEERRAVESRLAEAATHDSLTGLPNRSSFFEQFNHAIALADRNQEHIALLFVDMDGLKIVNDAFGHDGGDVLIQQVGTRLKGNIRKSDYVARLAGDEFVVILEHLINIDEDVRLVCTKLLGALAEPYDIRGRRIKLTASIGVSIFPQHGCCASELLHKADSAMYRVKNGGKNNFAVCEAERD